MRSESDSGATGLTDGTADESPSAKRENPGRPRNPDIDRAIIAAALDEVAELGYGGASMTGIARRAEVPKSTVYRRWESKEALVLEAMVHMRQTPPVTLTGDARLDLYNHMASLARQWQDKKRAAVTLSVITEAARNPDFYRVWEERFLEPFRARIATLVAVGIETNQLRPGLDVEIIGEIILALPLHLAMRPTDTDFSDLAERFTNLVFDGLAS